MALHLLRLCRVLLIVIIVVLLVIILLLLCLLCIILLLLLGLLHLAQGLPLLREGVCLGLVVCDDDVVKDGATLPLPQVEADEAEIVVLVQRVIILVLRVGNLLRLPEALVGGVADTLHVPLALVRRIVLHGR